FDGSMGTYFAEKAKMPSSECEGCNLTHPEIISGIHKEYLEAGAAAIKTNTFSANSIVCGSREAAAAVIEAGWRIANEAAAGYEAAVFADIGPLPGEPGPEVDAAAEYKAVADVFLKLGAKNFLLETFSTPDGLAETDAYIREKCPDAYIINSFAVQADGFTRDGVYIRSLHAAIAGAPIDAIGLNCVSSAPHMFELLKNAEPCSLSISVMPNAGYPVVARSRTIYDSSPDYYAGYVKRMTDIGANIIGGCCGTTPKHIAALKSMLDEDGTPKKMLPKDERPSEKGHYFNAFWDKLDNGKKPVAVELDPPDSFSYDRFMEGAWELKNAGADIITIADCPIARARMDSSILACKIHKDMGLDALPHMTCRDRNINATKALIFGLYAEGIRNVLLVTGDPITSADRDEVKTVFQFNSRKLAAYVSSLSREILPEPLHIFGALNLNARNFDVQLRLAHQKLENGMEGFLTQPVLTHQAFENLKRAKAELGGYILGGIMPVVSARNARFMDSEINGINVDPRIADMYEGLEKAEAEALAVKISCEIAERIRPYVDGYYIMTPFNRTGLVSKIVKNIKHFPSIDRR
ncbi:MAG: bifunctional homocysteine S-methyltransferase/methylenetetrahydrofolate reductase, partial [Eubacteriales bacterium]|nr:bifunctional homocysteine S-methyltransferase/methylenetetrahydrofolate reductase [Eubacteriales bacterium]